MKKIFIVIGLFVLIGCSNSYSVAEFPERPPELKNCSFFKLTNTEGAILYVTRCPNSITTTNITGKYPKRVVVIDGEEYIKKEK